MFGFCLRKIGFRFSLSDTIYALSSGVGTAISIVRISGNQACLALDLLSKSQPTESLLEPQHSLEKYKISPRKAHFKSLYSSQGKLLDQCLLLYFPKQHSYNNEEIIELHLHGSRAVVSAVFKQLKKKGMRMAERGQFTKRALINNKMDLIQAESINDLIRSQSQFGRQVAINNLMGKGVDYLEGVKKQMVRCLANLEAYIDFQEDEGDVKADLFDTNHKKVKELLESIEKTLQNYKNLQLIKQGINVTIIGKPNAGKSTLINGLAKKDVAIVSEEAGTTRDIIQTQMECGGILVNLYDTAGLRETGNKIEEEGIRRAKVRFRESQIRVVLIDLEQEEIRMDEVGEYQLVKWSREFQMNDQQQQQKGRDDGNISQQNNPNNNNIETILIINKSDKLTQQQLTHNKYYITVPQYPHPSNNTHSNNSTTTTLPPIQKKYTSLLISAKNQQSITSVEHILKKVIQQKFKLYEQDSHEIYFTRERYFDKLTKCCQYLERYLEEKRPDIACEYLRNAISEVSEIFGRTDCEDVLDVLFREFCIGK